MGPVVTEAKIQLPLGIIARSQRMLPTPHSSSHGSWSMTRASGRCVRHTHKIDLEIECGHVLDLASGPGTRADGEGTLQHSIRPCPQGHGPVVSVITASGSDEVVRKVLAFYRVARCQRLSPMIAEAIDRLEPKAAPPGRPVLRRELGQARSRPLLVSGCLLKPCPRHAT